MPNHSTTHMQIDGPAKDIARFKEAILGPDIPPDEYYDYVRHRWIDFNKILPMPDAIAATKDLRLSFEDIKNNPNNWYTWCCDNWGTRWNAYFQEVTFESKTEYHIQFDTAWSPPYGIIKALREQWPTLCFGGGGYTEGGNYEHDLDDEEFQP